MSDQETRIDQIERQMLVDRNATNTLLNRTDQLQNDFRTLQATLNQQFANMQQDLHLIIEMFRAQQAQLELVDQRFGVLEGRFDSLESKVDERFDQVGERFGKMDERFDQVIALLSQRGQ